MTDTDCDTPDMQAIIDHSNGRMAGAVTGTVPTKA